MDKPYVLYVAELIYNEISELKKNNSNISVNDAIEGFIGSESYKNVNKSSPPKYHKRPNFLMLFQDNLTPLAYKPAYMN